MILGIEGYEVRCKVSAPDHWLARGASRFGGPVFCRARGLSEKQSDCDVIFLGVEDVKRVRSFLRGLKNVHVRHISSRLPGIVADTLCEITALGKEITKGDRVASLIASPEGIIEVVVRSPWKSDIENMKIDKFLGRWGELVSGTLEKRQVTIPIEVGRLQEHVTEKLAEMAGVLIDTGYYDSKRPEGLTHAVLAKRLGISKPTLERRMRELESLGISSLFSTEAKLGKEDLKAAWDAFLRSSTRKE